MYMKTFFLKKKKNPEIQNTPDPIISAKNSQPVFCLLGEITPYTKDSTAQFLPVFHTAQVCLSTRDKSGAGQLIQEPRKTGLLSLKLQLRYI